MFFYTESRTGMSVDLDLQQSWKGGNFIKLPIFMSSSKSSECSALYIARVVSVPPRWERRAQIKELFSQYEEERQRGIN